MLIDTLNTIADLVSPWMLCCISAVIAIAALCHYLFGRRASVPFGLLLFLTYSVPAFSVAFAGAITYAYVCLTGRKLDGFGALQAATAFTTSAMYILITTHAYLIGRAHRDPQKTTMARPTAEASLEAERT